MIERQNTILGNRFVIANQLQGRRVLEDAASRDDLHFPPLGKLTQPTGKRADDLFLASPNFLKVDLGGTIIDTPFGTQLVHFTDHTSHMQ